MLGLRGEWEGWVGDWLRSGSTFSEIKLCI